MGQAIKLSEAVQAVKVDGSYVLMDIREDRYLFLTTIQSEWMDDILGHTGDLKDLAPRTRLFADRLYEQNLWAGERLRLQVASDRSTLAATDSWVGIDREIASDAGALPALRMARAVAHCWWLERSRDFSGVVSEVSRWKCRGRRKATTSEGAVKAELAAFNALTPFFFTSHKACRFRSLVLMKFLTEAGVAPEWVFAVRLAPFAAHCWVEWQGHVLNENLGTTQDFSEIMRV